MKKALVFTVFDRVNYFQQTLFTWRRVRGLKDWDIVFSIEPSAHLYKVLEEIEIFSEDTGVEISVHINPVRYGVLQHPWIILEKLFVEENYDFVVRAEDDLIVSDDILEYFSWAADTYEKDENVLTVHGMSFAEKESDPTKVEKLNGFNPWIWGTWKNRWEEYISPTWDHDYSTFNVFPGNQSGWDWNLNTRVFPALKFYGVYPVASRVDNIGIHGTHGTSENFAPAPSFISSQKPTLYTEVGT